MATFLWKDVPSKQLIVLRIQFDAVLVDVCVKLVSAEDLGDLHKLVVVIMTVEEWLFTKDLQNYRVSKSASMLLMTSSHHRSEHATIAP